MRALYGNIDVTGISIETRYWNSAGAIPAATDAATAFNNLPTNVSGYTNAPVYIPSLARRVDSLFVNLDGSVDTTWLAVGNPAGAKTNLATRIRVEVTAKSVSSIGVRFGVDCVGCVLLLDATTVIAQSYADLTWYGYYMMDISDTDVPQWVPSDQVLEASPVSLTKGTHVLELLSFENAADFGSGAQIDVGSGWTDVTAPVPSMALSVTKAGGGTGTVTSQPAGINCGTACSFSFPFGTLVTLTATATAPSVFAGWTGACTETAATCTVSLDQAKSVTATFNGSVTVAALTEETRNWQETPVPLTAAGVSAAFEALPPTVAGYSNTPIRLAALANNPGFVAGGVAGNIGWRYQFTLDVSGGPAKIGFNFNPDFSAGGAAWIDANEVGVLCGDLDCAANTQTLALANYTLAVGRHVITIIGFEHCCDRVAYATFDMGDGRGARDVSQLLAPVPSYTLTAAVTGAGRVVSMPGSINCGTDCSTTMPADTKITLAASPEAGWVFSGWSGACSGSGACVVTLTGSANVGATFTRIALTVLKTGTGAGVVTSTPAGIACGATCTANYLAGTEVTLTAVPDATSSIGAWSEPGCSGATCTVTLAGPKTISVALVRNTYLLSVTKSGTGTGTVTSSPAGINCGSLCAASFDAGTAVTLTAVPDPSSTFSGWSGACTDSTGPCVTTVTAAASVAATFTRKPDSTPPVLTCEATPRELWPVNHKMHEIRIVVSAIDAVSGQVPFKLLSVESNQPADAKGDGKSLLDIDGWHVGTADVLGQLRAERTGTSKDRIYKFTYGAADDAGNATTSSCTVVVPHDKK